MPFFLPYKHGDFYVELGVSIVGVASSGMVWRLRFRAKLDTGADVTSLPGCAKMLSAGKAQITISRDDQLNATSDATFSLSPCDFVEHKTLGQVEKTRCPRFLADLGVGGFSLDMLPVFFHGDLSVPHAIIGRDILMSNDGICFAQKGYQPRLCGTPVLA